MNDNFYYNHIDKTIDQFWINGINNTYYLIQVSYNKKGKLVNINLEKIK